MDKLDRIEFMEQLIQNPQETTRDVLMEIMDRVGGGNGLMALTPATMADRGGIIAKSAMVGRDKMLAIEATIIRLAPLLWASTGDVCTNVTQEYTVVPTNHKAKFAALMTTPANAFVKTTVNRKAWLRNEIYRSNVNFEGYAHWNAAVFYYVARNVVKMNEEDVNLVLRLIAFNQKIEYKSFLAPTAQTKKGAGAQFPEMDLMEYKLAIINLCNDLSKTIACHRERTGRRYSSRDVTPAGRDDKSADIAKQILSIFEQHRATAEQVGAQSGGSV